MAIYHCSIKIIGRSDGKSAVASSVQRSGEKLMDDRTGLIHDFTKKRGVVFKEVSLALCIVSVTLALIAVKYIPMDINVMSWWIGFSVMLNLLYHSYCNNNGY